MTLGIRFPSLGLNNCASHVLKAAIGANGRWPEMKTGGLTSSPSGKSKSVIRAPPPRTLVPFGQVALSAGAAKLKLREGPVASGVYFYRLKTSNYEKSYRMLLVR